MSIGELRRLPNSQLSEQSDDYVVFAFGPAVWVLATPKGDVCRIDTTEAAARTAESLGIGDTLARWEQRYGKAVRLDESGEAVFPNSRIRLDVEETQPGRHIVKGISLGMCPFE